MLVEDFTGMKQHEIDAFKNISGNLIGCHFSDSCVEELKWRLDALRIPAVKKEDWQPKGPKYL